MDNGTDSTHTVEVLTRPFPPKAIRTRTGGGDKPLSYVATQDVIRRLNEATGNRWSSRVVPEATQFLACGKNKRGFDEHLMLVLVELTIPDHGTRSGFGVQRVCLHGNTDDLLKAAASDGLKKAATNFGVALDLYGPDMEAEDSADTTPVSTPPRRAARVIAAPAPVLPFDDVPF